MEKKRVVAVVIGLELIGRNPFDLSSEEQQSDAEFVYYVQSTLDIAEFSVTQQKSAKSRFSAIRNYFWGQRSNIPQITK